MEILNHPHHNCPKDVFFPKGNWTFLCVVFFFPIEKSFTSWMGSKMFFKGEKNPQECPVSFWKEFLLRNMHQILLSFACLNPPRPICDVSSSPADWNDLKMPSEELSRSDTISQIRTFLKWEKEYLGYILVFNFPSDHSFLVQTMDFTHILKN